MSRNARDFSVAAWAGWGTLLLLATLVGVVSLRYALPVVPFPSSLPNFRTRHDWLIAHAVCSSVALLIGPWQFLIWVRRRWLRLHRWIGRIYCTAVGLGWIASLPIASHAFAGLVSSAGFLTLGALWVGSTAAGYFTIRAGRVEEHRKWMIRSYALTAAAITLRIYLPLLPLTGISFENSYRIIAWACWIPNLIFAEWLIRRARRTTDSERTLLPA